MGILKICNRSPGYFFTATDLMMVLDKASVIESEFLSRCAGEFNWITRWEEFQESAVF